MFKNLFKSNKSSSLKTVHCEITGAEAGMNNIIGLVRINGVIALKNLKNPVIDHDEKIIYSDKRPPFEFYSELFVPEKLKDDFGKLYTIIDDPDEIEKSSAILSEHGKIVFAAQSLAVFEEHIENGAELIKIPDHLFLAVIDTTASFSDKNCENWNCKFNSTGNKYRFKKVVHEFKTEVTLGYPSILAPGFDVGIGDCSNKNPNGTSYMFRTEQPFQKIDLCSNESAVDYCKKNNVIIYYNDFMNKGQVRVLTRYTESINRNLKNGYLFRSSNF